MTVPAMVLIRPREKGEKWSGEGDVLYGADYVADPPPSCYVDKPFIPLEYHPWHGLLCLGIDVEPIRTRLVYECPWTPNKYWWFVPKLLFTDDPKAWLKAAKLPDYLVGFRCGDESKRILDLGNALRAMVGHGYTTDTLPDDGSCHLRDAVVYTTVPGTWVGGKVWDWYNK
jgi:hypothetical protein